MRDHVVNTINAFIGNHAGFTLSSELPFEKDGSPLYTSNAKRVYVDREQITREPLYEFVSGDDIDQDITDVTAYVVTDAKNEPSNLSAFISDMRGVKNSPPAGVFRTQVEHTTTIENDLVTHQFVYTFIKIV